MRVATRRLRSALIMFGPYYDEHAIKPFEKTLSKFADALGAVRDLDVFRIKADQYAETLPDADRDRLKVLLDDWQQRLTSARERLIELLDSHRYAALVADFAEFVATPEQAARETQADKRPTPYLVSHVAPGLIYERYGEVRAYETALPDVSLNTLHALRIDAKRLRYTLEAFEEVLGSEAKKVIDSTRALQDHLGDLQDARVAVALMQDFVQRADENQPTAAVLQYMAARENEKQHLLAAVQQTWQAFTAPAVRRSLALAVSAL
jgi:CHAD domain-containing protein